MPREKCRSRRRTGSSRPARATRGEGWPGLPAPRASAPRSPSRRNARANTAVHPRRPATESARAERCRAAARATRVPAPSLPPIRGCRMEGAARAGKTCAGALGSRTVMAPVRALGLLALALVLSGTAGAGDSGLDSALERLLRSSALRGARVGVVVEDLETGRRLLAHAPDEALVPASNQKLLIAAAALSHWGPSHRFETPVLMEGEIVDGIDRGPALDRGTGRSEPGVRVAVEARRGGAAPRNPRDPRRDRDRQRATSKGRISTRTGSRSRRAPTTHRRARGARTTRASASTWCRARAWASPRKCDSRPRSRTSARSRRRRRCAGAGSSRSTSTCFRTARVRACA